MYLATKYDSLKAVLNVFTVLGIIAISGCTQPAARQEPKVGFQAIHGRLLQVHINGKQSYLPAGNDSIWRCDAICDGRFSIFVSADQKLGLPARVVNITVYSAKAGLPDMNVIYRPKVNVEADKDTFISGFECLSENGYSQPAVLPAGDYIIKVQVIGSKGWDTQLIMLKVVAADK